VADLPQDTIDVLHDNGQDALLEAELATLDLSANEKWTLEQVLLAYVAESVPPDVWAAGIAAGMRAVRRERAGSAAQGLLMD